MEIATEAPLGQAHPKPPPEGIGNKAMRATLVIPDDWAIRAEGSPRPSCTPQLSHKYTTFQQIRPLLRGTGKDSAHPRKPQRNPERIVTAPPKGVSGDPAWFELADLQGARRSLRWTSVRTEP